MPSRVLVTHVPNASGTPGPGKAASARVVHDTPNHVVLDATADTGGGYLVLLDSFAAGWRAQVDGVPAEMVQANGLFRALRLVPGRHRIEMTYRPLPLVIGAWISVASLLVVFTCLFWPTGLAARVPTMPRGIFPSGG